MNRFFRGNAVFAAIEIVGRLPMLFVVGYLANSVGPRIYGNWALVVAAGSITMGLASLGLNASIKRTASGAAPDAAKGYLIYALRITSIAVAVAGVALAAGREPIGTALGIEKGSRDLLALAGLLAFGSTVEALFDSYFKARERTRLQATLVLGRTCIEVAVVALVFGTDLIGGDAEGRLVLYVLIALGIKLVVLYPFLLVAAPRNRVLPDRPARATFLRFGWPMIPAGLLLWLTTQGDRIILGHAIDPRAFGWYAFAGAIALNLTYLRLAVFPLLLPRASVLHDHGDHAQVERLFNVSQRVYGGLLAGVILALAFVVDDFIEATAGDAFAPAATILLVLAVAVGLEGLFGIFEWVFLLVRRTTLVLVFNIFNMLLQVTAVLIVATLTGDATAVAWTVLGVVLVANAVRYTVARRVYSVRADRSVLIAVVCVGGLVAAAAAVADGLGTPGRLAAAATAGAAGLMLALRAAQTGNTAPTPIAAPTQTT